jgi:hypothetical protein
VHNLKFLSGLVEAMEIHESVIASRGIHPNVANESGRWSCDAT